MDRGFNWVFIFLRKHIVYFFSKPGWNQGVKKKKKKDCNYINIKHNFAESSF